MTTTVVGEAAATPPDLSTADLSAVLVPLLKGVTYRADDAAHWHALLQLQGRVRDHVAVLGLALTLDEAEGYAFLRSRAASDAPGATALPRLVARRPLTFPVSLLLALLRKRLAESDAAGGETRLILSHEQIVEMLRVFAPTSSNQARLIDQVEAQINRVIDLGFVRRLRGQNNVFEVQRILKAFVDAQWLVEFDARLAAYRALLDAEPDAAP